MLMPFLLLLLLLLMLLLLLRLSPLFLLLQLRMPANKTGTDEITCLPCKSRRLHRKQHKDTFEHADVHGLATTHARGSKHANTSIHIKSAYRCDIASTGIRTHSHKCAHEYRTCIHDVTNQTHKNAW